MAFNAVADVDQTLFRFAGARPEIMSEEIVGYLPNIRTVKMETNYRSTQTIVNQQRQSIAYNYSDLNGPYDQSLFKSLRPRDGAESGNPFVWNMFGFQEEEADYVASTITLLCDAEGYGWGDFFVGARTNSQLAYIEGALTRENIKYINLGGGSFWDSKHIQDVLAYIHLAYYELNPSDDVDTSRDLKRVLNIPSKFFVAPIGDKKGEYVPHRFLSNALFESIGGKYRNLDRERWREGVQDLMEFVTDIQLHIDHHGLAGAIRFVIENAYVKWLSHKEGLVYTDDAENGKVDDLLTVVNIASKFEEVDKFFAYVKRMREAAKASKRGDHSKRVVIGTVHRLKGKERPVVFGIGLCETNPGSILSEAAGLLPHTYSLIDPPNYGVLPTGGKGKIEDERCVFFVLISRAQERVYLSGFRNYRDKVFGPSRFVREIGLAKEVSNC
jgi:DNA helicase-2/ATP-dependent DNA helicase PcrA